MLHILLVQSELKALEKKIKQLRENIYVLPRLVVENVTTFGSPAIKFGIKITDKTYVNAENNWNGRCFYFPSFSTQKYTHHKARFYATVTRDHFLVALGYTHDISGKLIPDYEYCCSNISAILNGEPTRLPKEVVEKLEEMIRRLKNQYIPVLHNTSPPKPD